MSLDIVISRKEFYFIDKWSQPNVTHTAKNTQQVKLQLYKTLSSISYISYGTYNHLS